MPDYFDVQAEEQRVMDEGRKLTQRWMMTRFMQPPTKKLPLECRKGDEPLVYIRIPKGFTITLDNLDMCQVGEAPTRDKDNRVITKGGIYQVPLSIADHFYAKANGAEKIDASELPAIKGKMASLQEGAEKAIADARARGLTEKDPEMATLLKMADDARSVLQSMAGLGI